MSERMDLVDPGGARCTFYQLRRQVNTVTTTAARRAEIANEVDMIFAEVE